MERMWLHTSPKIWWQWRAKLRRKKKKLIPVFLMFLNLIQFQNKNAEKSSQHKDLTFLAHVSELMTSKPISVFSWCSRVCPFPQSLLTKVLVTMNSCLKVLQFSCVKNGLYFIMHFCYFFILCLQLLAPFNWKLFIFLQKPQSPLNCILNIISLSSDWMEISLEYPSVVSPDPFLFR